MKVKFSIRYKILGVVTALLVAAICLYLVLAMSIFKQDKTELIFDLNRGLVSTLSTEVETTLRGASDKLKLYALLSNENQKTQSVFTNVLENDALLTYVELYEQNPDGKPKSVSKVSDKAFLKLYNIDESYFEDELSEKRPIPFNEIQSNSLHVWNASLPQMPPLIGLGISIVKEGAKHQPEKLMAVVGYIKVDLFIKNLKSSNLTQAFLLDRAGKVLVHSKADLMTALMDYSQSPIVKKLEDKNISSGVLEYNFEKKNYLGAFSKTTFAGVTAVSQVESDKAFMAVQHLVRRSLIFALIVSTITFIATVFFSRTLTQPLLNLVEAMQKVSEGQLDAVLKVKSQNRDEIAVLSQSFNKMTVDLKSSREQLEEINKELENKVLDRTKKLEEQNRAVKEAQEALLRTTRLASVGEIAGRTAHEVLNPLTSIMARVNKVQKRLNDQVAQDKNLLGEILNAWKSEIKDKGFDGLLKSLKEPSQILPGQTLLEEDLKNVNEIFSRWDSDLKNLENDTAFLMQQAGRIEKILTSMRSLSHIGGSKGHYNAHQILHDSVNIVSDLFSRTRTKIEEKFNAAQDDIWVDRDELIQVMGNILKNSLHAVVEAKTAAGCVSIETKLEGEKFCIDIIDNGIGIKSENKNKLFESNFSTKTPEVGTGLGLSISRRFIRAFHGDLFLVKSEAHKETVFRIELPLYKKNREEVAA